MDRDYKANDLTEDDVRREALAQQRREQLGLEHPEVVERSTKMWVPLALAAALMAGLGYFIFSADTTATPNTQTGAVTQSDPSPN
jgi:hypothetical protein